MTTSDVTNLFYHLEPFLAQIPASGMLGIKVMALQPDATLLHLPMRGNTNHHHSVFGGSLSLVATLAGWACAHGSLPQAGGNIVIKSSHMRYLAPAISDVWALAVVNADDLAKAQAMAIRFGRASLTITCELYCIENDMGDVMPDIQTVVQGKSVASFTGEFVAVMTDK